jgi:hypothetical protein
MEIEELLARAWKAVADAGIPESLQEMAFREALARLSASRPQGPAVPEGGSSQASSAAEGSAHGKTDRELFTKFSTESGISVEELEQVFYIAGGEFHLNGPRSRLGKTNSDQAKTVAVALTAAYDYGLDRKSIPDSLVRSESDRLKADLGGNWAKSMNAVSGVSWVGPARQKEFKTKADTPEALRKVVGAILGSTAE